MIPGYSMRWRSISWRLKPQLLASADHQHLWYWLRNMHECVIAMVKNYTKLRHLNGEKHQKFITRKNVFAQTNSARNRLSIIEIWNKTTMRILPRKGVNVICHALQWRHDDRDGVSNHQPHDCLLSILDNMIIHPSGNEAGIFHENEINIMAPLRPQLLAPWSAFMILTM